MTKIAVKIPGLTMKNPLMPASGTFGFGDTPASTKFDLNQMGAMVMKTATVSSRTGNPQPQIKVLEDGVLNSVGLTNPGVDSVVADKILPFKAKYPDLPIVASVGGSSVADYVEVAGKLANSGAVSALEINVSCPNVANGGMHFGTDPEVVENLTSKVKAASGQVPIYVKLTPNVTDIAVIAKAAENGGADGVSLINTILGLEIDLKTCRPVLGNNYGGLSGQSVQPVALRMVNQVYQAVKIPIIGMGGIATAEDVAKFMLAGASAVAVGTAHFKDSLAIPHIAAELPRVLDEMGVSDINDLVGQLKFN